MSELSAQARASMGLWLMSTKSNVHFYCFFISQKNMLSIGVDCSLTAQDLLLLVTMQWILLFTTRYFALLLFPLETIEIGAVPDVS